MKNKLILIVEDDLLVAKDIKQILEGEGYSAVSNIMDYDVAIKTIHDLNPDLVFLDINLSGATDGGGIKIAKHLNHLGTIPFVYISSSFDKMTLEKVKATRPYGYIMKPFRDVDIIVNSELAINNFKYRNVDPLRIEKGAETEAPYRIRNVVDYINANIYEKIDISELAAMAKWKKHHFIRVFSSTMGITPYKYILERKMEVAKLLIENTDQPILEISFDLNFQNYSNFYLAFKRMYENSPEVSRRNKRVDNFIFEDNSKTQKYDY